MEGTLTVPLLPLAQVANVPPPKGTNVYLFFDTTNNNELKVKKSDGTISPVLAGAVVIKFV